LLAMWSLRASYSSGGNGGRTGDGVNNIGECPLDMGVRALVNDDLGRFVS